MNNNSITIANPEPSPWRGEGAETKFEIGKEELAYATLMGDGFFNGNRLYFCQCCKNKEYVDFIANLFEKYWKINKSTRYIYDKKRNKNYCQYGFKTYSEPFFIHLRKKVFYKNGIKAINQRILSKLTPLGLAIWYMDDGSLNRRESVLCTHAYTKKENDIIKDYFFRKWNIKCRIAIHKQKYYMIVFNTGNTIKFLKIINPYVHPSMYYKVDLKSKYSRWLPRSKYNTELLSLCGE